MCKVTAVERTVDRAVNEFYIAMRVAEEGAHARRPTTSAAVGRRSKTTQSGGWRKQAAQGKALENARGRRFEGI
jgi:hypothetical protein